MDRKDADEIDREVVEQVPPIGHKPKLPQDRIAEHARTNPSSLVTAISKTAAASEIVCAGGASLLTMPTVLASPFQR
jgi:hypothetical protein